MENNAAQIMSVIVSHQGQNYLLNIPWKNIDYFTIHKPRYFRQNWRKNSFPSSFLEGNR